MGQSSRHDKMSIKKNPPLSFLGGGGREVHNLPGWTARHH